MYETNQLKFKLLVSAFAAIIPVFANYPALAQKHENGTASSTTTSVKSNAPLNAERINSVFQMVDKLQKTKGAGIKAFETVTAQKFNCLNTFMYVSENNPNNDITLIEMPFNQNNKILYAELSVNPNLLITLRDVQKRFGKWERLSKSKGNAEENILPQYRYYFDHGSLAFNFRSPSHKTLTSITVYYDH